MRLIFLRISLLITFCVYSYKIFSQNSLADTTAETASFKNAVKFYHQFLSPETGLYNGSEYAYKLYYPFVINEGDPFFLTKQFDTGTVFYNRILYENVPLLYDLVKEEVLTKNPTNTSIIRLNNEKIEWFTILGHRFIKLYKDSVNHPEFHTGFYDQLYDGNTALYKKVSKIFKENTASFQGVNKYIVDVNGYYIKKNNQYYKVKNKKSLLGVLNNKKKEIDQFMRKNKLNVKRTREYTLTKTVVYYDSINK